MIKYGENLHMRYLIEHGSQLYFHTEDEIDDILSRNFGEIDLLIYFTFDGIMYEYFRFSTRDEFEQALKLINSRKLNGGYRGDI